jgi:recombinational DNA repair protein (RecF pathway)
MRTIKGHFVVKTNNITECCFCDEPINHIKKDVLGKIFICKCGASFIRPVSKLRSVQLSFANQAEKDELINLLKQLS